VLKRRCDWDYVDLVNTLKIINNVNIVNSIKIDVGLRVYFG